MAAFSAAETAVSSTFFGGSLGALVKASMVILPFSSVAFSTAASKASRAASSWPSEALILLTSLRMTRGTASVVPFW